jgi:transcriptional regulator with XRE-family HTH domain
MIIWKLADILKAHGIQTPLQLKRELEEKLGVSISRQALTKLIENEPQELRLETAQLLCDFLGLPLENFLLITPEKREKSSQELIQPYKAKRTPKIHTMTNPMDFF